jgi:hypothetical protein
VHWEQDGVLFNHAGKPVDEAGNPREMPQPKQKSAHDDLEGLSDQTLGLMLRRFGEEFTTREAAIALLSGGSAPMMPTRRRASLGDIAGAG